MPRPDKVQAVDEIRSRFAESAGVIITEYRGLRVSQMQALRRDLKDAGAELKVIKNTLARIATAEMEIAELEELFAGPVAVVFYEGDPVPAAKVLKTFAKESPDLAVKGGLLSGRFLDAKQAAALSNLEPREVLLARVAGAVQAPMTKMAGAAAALLRNAVGVVDALLRQRQEIEGTPGGSAGAGESGAQADTGLAEAAGGEAEAAGAEDTAGDEPAPTAGDGVVESEGETDGS